MSRLPTRRMRIGSSARSQIDTPASRTFWRVSGVMKAPPPVARTCGPLLSRRAITFASRSRKNASPWSAKISLMDFWATRSISSSVSMKGSASRVARRLPIEDFPQPMRPTSTSERRPSARRTVSTLSLPCSMLLSVTRRPEGRHGDRFQMRAHSY